LEHSVSASKIAHFFLAFRKSPEYISFASSSFYQQCGGLPSDKNKERQEKPNGAPLEGTACAFFCAHAALQMRERTTPRKRKRSEKEEKPYNPAG
jgi:hypothetical protein